MIPPEPLHSLESATAWSGLGIGSLAGGALVGFSLPAGQGLWVILSGAAVSCFSFLKGQLVLKGELTSQKDRLTAFESHVEDKFDGITDRTATLQRGHERIEGKVDKILGGLEALRVDRLNRNVRDNAFQDDVRANMASPINTPDPDAPPAHRPEHTP